MQRPPEYLRLLKRIERRFELTRTVYALGPLRLSFMQVKDPDVVLDQIVDAEDSREKQTGQRRDGNVLHLPYWAELWDSAVGLATLLTDPKFNPRDQAVLDLGCGMGLTGMAAAALGATVTLADLEADALLFAQLNCWAWRERTTIRRLDWQRDRLAESFHTILGADVLYDRTQWEFLEPFFRHHLRLNGRVLLGEPGRQTGDLFIDWISERGWSLTQHDQKIAGRVRPIRIFELLPLSRTRGKGLG